MDILYLSVWHLLGGILFFAGQTLLIYKLVTIQKQQHKNQQALLAAIEANRHLVAKERRYRLVTENMKDVLWILDVETLTFIYASPSVFETLGFTLEEFISSPFEMLLSPADKALILEDVVERTKGLLPGSEHSTVYMREVQQRCKDGSTIWTEMSMYYYINDATNKIEIQGIGRNIQKRKEAEIALSLIHI